MEYMARVGYNTKGMVGLMNVLRGISKHKPNAIEMMFATHPMSDERYKTAIEKNRSQYRLTQSLPLYRDRYMDHTANLRRMRRAIEEMQNGEKEMVRKKFGAAETHYRAALKRASNDYAGLVMMAKCKLAQKKYDQARRYAEKAKQVYPQEAQAYHISGMAKMMKRDFGAAYEEFNSYEKMLPGNPNTIFLKGLSLEGMRHHRESAMEYTRYLKVDTKSKQAQHAYQRLVKWGYIKPEKK